MQLIYGWAAVMRNGERKSWLDGKGEKQERKHSWVMMGLWWYWAPIFQMKQEAWSDIVYLSPFVILLFKKNGIKIRHWESAFHLDSKPQFSSLLSSSDCFLHIQQPPWGQNRDLWCAHQRKGILSNNFATSEADLSTCLLNHCWRKVGAMLLCCKSADEKKKQCRGEIFPFNTAVFGLGLVPSQSTWWLNLPWCIGKDSQ